MFTNFMHVCATVEFVFDLFTFFFLKKKIILSFVLKKHWNSCYYSFIESTSIFFSCISL